MDREQVRRDAEKILASDVMLAASAYRELASSLLAELEQAERRQAEAEQNAAHIAEVHKNELLARQQAEREREEWKEGAEEALAEASSLREQAGSLRARLAAVQEREAVLVEALTRISDPSYVGSYDEANVIEIYRKWAKSALSKWEQAQGEKP